jgi:cytoskeletal protein CcmA (bactofilin family)
MTIIGRHLVINGEVSCEDDLTIEGAVEGFVSVREGTLTIEPPARVDADIRAARVVVRGYVSGAITASERIELAPSARMTGSLSAGVIAIGEGAEFNGAIDMNRRTIAARVAEYRAGRADTG